MFSNLVFWVSNESHPSRWVGRLHDLLFQAGTAAVVTVLVRERLCVTVQFVAPPAAVVAVVGL